MAINLKTRSAKGSPLEFAEVDANFKAIQDSINALQNSGYLTLIQAKELISPDQILSNLGYEPYDALNPRKFQTLEDVGLAIESAAGKDSALMINLEKKVDQVTGKTLSSNDYTNEAVELVSKIDGKSQADALVLLKAEILTTCDLAKGNIFKITLDMPITLIFSNALASGTPSTFVLDVVSGGGYSITWPASVKWSNGTTPVLTATTGKQDAFVFVTLDGGLSYLGFVSGLNL